MARTLLVPVGALLALAAIIVVVMWSGQRRLIYFPQGAPAGPASASVPGARDVTLTTADGLALGGWYLPAAEGHPTLLVASGNAGHRGLRAPLMAALGRRGVGVLLFDYRGYGGNPGNPSEAGLALDVRAARAYLLDDAGVAARDLAYYGESLGCAVVVELATEHPPAALTLRSPFTSLADMAGVHYPFLPAGRLLRDRYPVADRIAMVDVPTLVVLGDRDSIVPPEQSLAVAREAGGATEVVEVSGADHNDAALLDGDELIGAVVELIM